MTTGWRTWIVAAIAAGGLGAQTLPSASFAADKKPAPTITEEASKALIDMGKSLLSPEFSFKVQTIRIYSGPNAESLHIFHTIDVKVRQPDRMQASMSGDDDPVKLF